MVIQLENQRLNYPYEEHWLFDHEVLLKRKMMVLMMDYLPDVCCWSVCDGIPPENIINGSPLDILKE